MANRIRIQLFNSVWKSDVDYIYPEKYKAWIEKQYRKFPEATHIRIGNDCAMDINDVLNSTQIKNKLRG